jgi:hypothetical protein
VKLGRRVQVNFQDEHGTWHTRFDGMIAEIDIDESVTGEEATALIVCADVLALLNRDDGFQSWTVEEARSFGPLVQYVLDEPNTALAASDTSGNSNPALQPAVYTSPPFSPTNTSRVYLNNPVVSFGGDGAIETSVEPTIFTAYNAPTTSQISSPVSGALFSATVNNAGSATALGGPSAQFQGTIPTLTVGADSFTIVGWLLPDFSTIDGGATIGYQMECLALSNSRTGAMLSIELQSPSIGTVNYQATFYNNFLKSAGSSASTAAGGGTSGAPANSAAMVAVTVNAATRVVTCYVGGNFFDRGLVMSSTGSTITIAAGTTFNYLTIGGPIGGGNGFLGSINNVCVYKTLLNTTQLTDLATVGTWGGSYRNSPGTVVRRVASTYTGLPSYWLGTIDSGLSACDYLDLTGGTPPDVMQTLMQTEKGLYFVNAAGKVTFHDRGRRMAPGAAVATIPAGAYNEGIKPRVTDQYMCNSEALQNNRGGLGVLAENPESIADYGRYSNGTVQSPQTLPLPAWSGVEIQRQVSIPGDFNYVPLSDNRYIEDAASWDVNTMAEPRQRLSSLTIDMLTAGGASYMPPSTVFNIEIDSLVTLGQNLPWWPDDTNNADLFIEGRNETYSNNVATISYYVSPAFPSKAWIPGDATYGVLDSTTRLGIPRQVVPLFPVENGSTFSTSMNAGANGIGFVGSADVRAPAKLIAAKLRPLMAFAQQVTTANSVATATYTYINWDTFVVDTASGWNRYRNGQVAYIVPTYGWYEVHVTAQFAANGTGIRFAQIIQNQTGGIRTLSPVAVTAATGPRMGLTTSAFIWCSIGDAIAVQVWQDSGGTLATALTNGGSHMSIIYRGADAGLGHD